MAISASSLPYLSVACGLGRHRHALLLDLSTSNLCSLSSNVVDVKHDCEVRGEGRDGSFRAHRRHIWWLQPFSSSWRWHGIGMRLKRRRWAKIFVYCFYPYVSIMYNCNYKFTFTCTYSVPHYEDGSTTVLQRKLFSCMKPIAMRSRQWDEFPTLWIYGNRFISKILLITRGYKYCFWGYYGCSYSFHQWNAFGLQFFYI